MPGDYDLHQASRRERMMRDLGKALRQGFLKFAAAARQESPAPIALKYSPQTGPIDIQIGLKRAAFGHDYDSRGDRGGRPIARRRSSSSPRPVIDSDRCDSDDIR